MKIRGRLGPYPTDGKSIQILNRILTWTKRGLVYEPDQRHAELIVREVGVEDARALVTPGIKVEADAENDETLSAGSATPLDGLCYGS